MTETCAICGERTDLHWRHGRWQGCQWTPRLLALRERITAQLHASLPRVTRATETKERTHG